MSRAIFLTADEADKVRGLSPSKEGHALVPVETGDGRFMLGAGVLDMDAFAYAHDFLERLPQGEPVAAKEGDETAAAADEPSKLTVWSAEKVQARPLLRGDGLRSRAR